jgi:prepilin-type N-terminal cleavage/methylation domain-containing protein
MRKLSMRARDQRPYRRGSPRGAARGVGLGGFSLVELVIVVVIIGIIAAIAIPRMSRGSAGAADNALAENLAILRKAIDVFQAEHDGVYPAPGPSCTVADLLTKYSDAAGAAVSDQKDTANGVYIYGPYLRTVPPVTVGDNRGKNGIAYSGASLQAASPSSDTGWLYNGADGTIAPYTGAATTDSAGRPYSSY